jgi:AraC-like DNA-binding protein
MAILTYIPGPPLSDSVELFWYYDRYAQRHARERILPTGDVRLIIKLGEDVLTTYDDDGLRPMGTYRGPLVWGPHSEHSIIGTPPLASCMGVNFTPGGATAFFGATAGEPAGLKIPLDDLWGRAAGELYERLLEAKSPGVRFRILERILLDRVVAAPERHPAVRYAIDAFQAASGNRTIGEVSEETGLSPRRFIELFRAQVGLTPKLYCRVRRFQAALALIERRAQPNWVDLACRCGYFDQAHFIRDFRAFSGLSPTGYLADRTDHRNHVRFDPERPRVDARWTEFHLEAGKELGVRIRG